jgi:hypothetical protein
MKRLIAAAAVLASVTPVAFAGQLTLFADHDFRGNQVTLQGDAPNLRDVGFNDRASSVIVRSGTWQICEHKDFGGYCAELTPGEYRELPRFNDNISSIHEVRGGGRWRDGDRGGDGYGRRDDYRGDDRHEQGGDYRGDYRGGHGGQAVQLFAGPRFEGQEIGLSRDLRTFNDIGFNDRAGSLLIREGEWQFCEHADYRGQCIVLGPGRYAFLEQMNNRISSMRRIR